MGRLDKLRKANDALLENQLSVTRHLEQLGEECARISNGFGNAGDILEDIDRSFSEVTGIKNKKDLKFLFIATSLLCTKWLIMGQAIPLDFDFKHDPHKRERLDHDDPEIIQNEKDKIKNHKKYGKEKDASKDYSQDGYRTVAQILYRPVPYDAISKTTYEKSPELYEAIVQQLVPDTLNGKTKRVLTWGHDPIFGYLFGTVNIMTRSVTFRLPAFDTYQVSEKFIKIKTDRQSTFCTEIGHAFESYQEDSLRLGAAVFKQGLHLKSDMYTKLGLPIPFLSAEKALELMEKGWNSVEAAAAIRKVMTKVAKNSAIIGTQFVLSLLINEIIKAIHLLVYEEEKDGDIKLYQVRTRKILTAANCISSSSNLLFCTMYGVATKDAIGAAKRLDVGGLIETTHRLVTDTRFINEIKREYIRENLASRILGDSDFDWWYLDENGEISYA